MSNNLPKEAAQSQQLSWVSGLKPEHKCRKIAQAQMSEGRDWWLGEITEPVAGHEIETHCLHLKTPLKDVVFLCNNGDFEQLSVLCRRALGHPINESWMQAQLQITKRDEVVIQSPPIVSIESEREITFKFMDGTEELKQEIQRLKEENEGLESAVRITESQLIIANQGIDQMKEENAALTKLLHDRDKENSTSFKF